MRPELDRLRQLEQHLLELNPTDFLAADAALPADLTAQRAAYAALREAGRRQLRRELAAIHEQLYGAGIGRWVWAAAGRGARQLFVRWRRLRGYFPPF